MKLSEMKEKKKKILIYGKAGVGKTALVMTLGEKLQLLDVDDGVTTGKRLEDELKRVNLLLLPPKEIALI